MAKLVLSRGACPVCDRDVLRTVNCQAGVTREVFQCPAHGRLEYGPGMVPLEAMGQAEETASELLVAQPLTGLELVY